MSCQLYYNYESRTLCDSDGVALALVPELRFQEQPVWAITILDNEGNNYDLTGISTFRAAIDKDFQSATEVMCRTLPENITVSGNKILVPLDACTESFLTAVNGKETLPAYFELSGFDSNGTRTLYLFFPIITGMVLDPINDELIALDSLNLFAGKDYVLALLRAGYELQFSSDGSEAHAVQTANDISYRFRNASALGTWSPWIAMIQGPAGNNLQVQYSENSSNWHSSCTSEDRYIRFSCDGGSTWGNAVTVRPGEEISLAGRILSVGNSSITIPEQSVPSFSRSIVSASKILTDKEWTIVTANCTLTLPAVTEGAFVKVSTSGTADSVLVAPANGDTITVGSSSTSDGVRLDRTNMSVELFGTASGWVIADLSGGIIIESN